MKKAKLSLSAREQFFAMLKKSGAPPEMQAKMMPIADLFEALGWLGMLDKCLGIEVRIAEDKNMASMEKRAEADLKRRTKRGEDTTGLGEYLTAAPGSLRVGPMLAKMLGKRKKGAVK